jgi:hypothetical protein
VAAQLLSSRGLTEAVGLEHNLVRNGEGNGGAEPDRYGQERKLAPPVTPRGDRAAGRPRCCPGAKGEPQHDAGNSRKHIASRSTGDGYADQQHRRR